MTINVQQKIIYALERQERSLRAHADRLMRKRDYSAELPGADADRMLEAIQLLTPAVAGGTAVEAAASVEREQCAQAIEALRDDHCRSTQRGGPEGACTPDDANCNFVVAWNDAIRAIRARGETFAAALDKDRREPR